MKLIIMLYFSLIFASSINFVASYTNHKIRLYDLIRKAVHEMNSAQLFDVTNTKDTPSSTISPIDEQSNSVKTEKDNNVHARDSTDSSEDDYFKWASLNRRPIESLIGRKRALGEKLSLRDLRTQRINGGLWRSGLVG